MFLYETLWKTAHRSETDFAYFARALVHHKKETENPGFFLKNGYDEYCSGKTTRWLLDEANSQGLYVGLNVPQFYHAMRFDSVHQLCWTPEEYVVRQARYAHYANRWRVLRSRSGEPSAYRRNKLHKKKGGPSQKELWRRETGHYLDKAEHGYRRRGANRTDKREFNSWVRQTSKRLIREGRWKEIPAFKPPWFD